MTRELIPAAVVGAGHAALTVVAALNQRDIIPTVFAPDDRIGDTWRNRYRSLRLNTDAPSSAIPNQRPSSPLPRWPTGHEWADYLADVAEHLKFEHYPTAVEVIARNKQRWAISTARSSYNADNVVVATGRDRVPHLPPWPGVSDTTIPVTHSSNYRTSSDFEHMKVLVVGSGNSGTEIAHLLTEHAASVAISIRTRPLFVRRETVGVSITQLGRLAKHIPGPILERGAPLLQQVLMGDLSDLGLGPPELTLTSDLVHTQGPTVDAGFLDSVASGAISVAGDIDHFTESEVVLVDGTRLAPDALIAATGYRTGLSGLVPGDVIDEDGWPRAMTPPYEAAAGLFFAGFGPATLTSFMPDFVEHLPTIALAIAEDRLLR